MAATNMAMVRRRASIIAVLGVAAAVLTAPVAAASGSTAAYPGCAPAGAARVVVGRVSCQQLASADLGGTTAFSYVVPLACAPARVRCPVLYLLHGFGGDYRSMLGTAAHPSAWVQALTRGPTVDPRRVADPWFAAAPSTWVRQRSLDVILVAPDGRTVPGGHGPAPGLDGFWSDWNPKYAEGGAAARYDTPPPRFEHYVVHELTTYVERRFHAGRGREWRSLAGESLGGFGAYKDGLQHPDVWASIGSVSGAHNFLFLPGIDPARRSSTSPVPGVAGGVRLPALPGPTSAVPVAALPSQAQGFAVVLVALGDPAVDQAYFRGNTPRDLAMNGRAWRARAPSLVIRGFSNDAVPRRTEDLANPGDYAGAQAFESIVLPMNVDMELAFADEGVVDTYERHPGIHSGLYWDPYIRQQLEAQYAAMRHRDASGDPPPAPSVFDYRTVSPSFSVWGWRVSVTRPTTEFLTLRNVMCRSLTLQGTGVVRITPPPACRVRTVTVDLGPSGPTDEPAGLGASSVYGRTVTVMLRPR